MHIATLFIGTSIMFDTTKLLLTGNTYLAIIASNAYAILCKTFKTYSPQSNVSLMVTYLNL